MSQEIEPSSPMALSLAESLGQVIRRERLYIGATEGSGQYYNKDEVMVKRHLLNMAKMAYILDLMDLGLVELVRWTIMLNDNK